MGMRPVSTPSWVETAYALSNRSLGVLIVGPEIWLGTGPVKQSG
jgi:hypothetical protein